MRYYSRSTETTYLSHVHASIPADAVPISDERYLSVIANPERGKIRGHDADGLPILVDPAPLATEQLAAMERAWRDRQLTETDGLVARHRDELEEDNAMTLTHSQYAELQVYRRALRSWPQSPMFPQPGHRPSIPSWLSSQIE